MNKVSGETARVQLEMPDKWICVECFEKTSLHILHKDDLCIDVECCICNEKILKDSNYYYMDCVINLFRKSEDNFYYKYQYASDESSLDNMEFSFEKVVHDSLFFKKCNDDCYAHVANINTDFSHKKICKIISSDLHDAKINFFSKNYKYKHRNNNSVEDLEKKWDEISHSLKNKVRFCNKDAEDFFESFICEAIRNNKNPNAILTELSKGTFLYRARKCIPSEKYKILENIEKEMYAPNSEVADNNRMSPQGMPFLYLGDSSGTCQMEIDSGKYSDLIIYSKFKTLNNLRFFDFTKFEEDFFSHDPLSVFDSSFVDRTKCRYFMINILQTKISNPKISNLDYLMTQFFCEMIKNPKWKMDIDGVAYKSTKNPNGKNYAIFDPHEPKVKKRFEITLYNT